MGLQFDINNNVEDFTIVLSTRYYKHYGEILNVKRETVRNKKILNGANEFSFEVYKTLNNITERLWDDISDFKLIWVKELNEYFEIYVSINDSVENPIKTITATSLCEAELGQVNLHNIEINTENDIMRDDYVITTFYNSNNPKASLLHRILDKVPHYSIKHVDESLMNLQRSFSINGTTIYDFLTGNCSNEFNCLFLFDSTDRSISVYDLYTVCNICGYRGEYSDICPKCENTDLIYFGEDTTIFVDKENLTDSITFETDTGSIKNCFKLEVGDDSMNAAIRDINPNGTDYIVIVPDWQKADMPDELVEALDSYDALYESKVDEYEGISEKLYDLINEILYYESEMMPDIDVSEITPETEAIKLTTSNLSPLALSSVTSSTSKTTVESALKNYAKVYIKTGYVKLDINESAFSLTENDDGSYTGVWTGNFKVTSYADETINSYSDIITVEINDDYDYFINQKILKNITEKDDDCSVFDVLNINDIDDFSSALGLYCLDRLKSFYDAIQSALDALVQLNEANEGDYYDALYSPYYQKLQTCQLEIDKRQATIDELNNKYNIQVSEKSSIQNELNFENYLRNYSKTEDLYKIFCMYRREDKYSNSNYISDGLSNSEIFDNARKFMTTARQELIKSATCQHSISSTLHNLLIMPEFKPIIDKFELGNWIRISVDDIIYRLRLVSYELSFSNIQTLNVEFSDLTKAINISNEAKDIISSAKSMATSYSYVTRQASKGNDAQVELNNLRKNSLDTSLYKIKNNDHEEVVTDSYGVLARSYDDTIDEYSPEQLKFTHNLLCYTNNNWASIKTTIGKQNYTLDGVEYEDYGANADTLISGKVISGDIYSNNYSSANNKGAHINLRDGSFTLADGKMQYNSTNNTLTFTNVTMDWDYCNTPSASQIGLDVDSISSITNSVQTLNNYIRFEDGNIILGEGDNEITLKIMNDRISFLQGDIEVAYFSNQKLYVISTECENELSIGDFVFTIDEGLALQKR